MGGDTARDDAFGETPPHIAARDGTAEAVSVLLAGGTNAKARAGDGKLPFDLAKWNGKVEGTEA